jgi:hypothetical protein
MRAIACGVLVLMSCGAANAQTYDGLQIRLGMYSLNPDGGERPGGIWYVHAKPSIGKPAQSFWSFGETCEAWSVSSKPYAREDATTAWRIETTPIRVEGEAVTFRLRWVRVAPLKQQLEQLSFDDAKARTPSEDLELTLRPGQSYPVDSVRVPAGAKNVHGKQCGPSESIRVSVDVYPDADVERRLVVADLWLVERLSNGSETPRSEPLTVRGLPNRPFRFYFDSIVDGAATLDIYGILLAKPESDAIAVSVETRGRWVPESRNFSGAQQFFKSEIKIKPTETVEIRLPPIEAGPFAKRSLSIRVRARQPR